MKELELRRHSRCDLCAKRVVEASGLPLFWRITVERFGIDLAAARRQDGLGAFLGSSILAQVMGDDADLAKPVMEPATLTVCETCAIEHAGLLVDAALKKSNTKETTG
jgi:hypothetical protein